jgi:dolichol-phosphate mannosyltransferase
MTSIIVPTYKEAPNLRALVERIAQAMGPTGEAYEVIVVDDNSRDGSDQIMAELAGEGKPVRLITRVDERGLSSAVLEGFHHARGDVLVCMDADLSHPPEAIPKLVEAVRRDGADFAIGSRYVPGAGTDESWGFLRGLNSKVATVLARPFTKIKDPMAGFFALPRAAFLSASALKPVGYKIALELIVKCRCHDIREIPIHFANRKFGRSKLSLREQVNYIRHLKRLADFKFGWFSELVQFSFIGATGAVVDLFSYAMLLDLAVHPIVRATKASPGAADGMEDVARGLAIFIAMTWNFFCNRRITFSHSRRGNILHQYWKFVTACSIGGLVNLTISRTLPRLVQFFSDHLLVAALLGILAGLAFNFVLSRHWVFRRHHPKDAVDKERPG